MLIMVCGLPELLRLPTPALHRCDEVIDENLGKTVPLLMKSNPHVLQVTGDLGLAVTRHSCVSETGSIGLRSGEHALPLVRSNSWDAHLAVPNDPRYARLETNLGIEQAKEG
ncbi:hypothetical protein TNCV_3966701 [Trichonephila clavipes]|nr:hypothetical protein TNCV_3966701 [Trichonephila clavipes]